MSYLKIDTNGIIEPTKQYLQALEQRKQAYDKMIEQRKQLKNGGK